MREPLACAFSRFKTRPITPHLEALRSACFKGLPPHHPGRIQSNQFSNPSTEKIQTSPLKTQSSRRLPMILETLPVGPLQCNCSILGDEASREAIVVDPGDDIPRILALLAKHSLTVKQIVITHAHIDHIAGAHRLKQLTGAPILYNQNDLPLVKMMDVQAAWLGIPTPAVFNPDDT